MDEKMFKELLGTGLKEFKESVTGEIKAAVKPLEERLEKIEKLPAKAVAAPAIITSSAKYKGYTLSKQMVSIRERAAKNPRLFPMFSDDQKTEEFAKFLIAYTRVLKGDMSAMADIQAFQKANYAEGADATGGYLVPIEYENEMIQLARDGNQLLQEVAYYEMGTDNKKVPAEGSLVTVEWDDEAGTIGDSEGTFDEVDLVAKRLNGLATVSNELLMDASFDLSGVLTEQFAYATGQELINQILNGNNNPFYGVAGTTAGYSVVLGSGSTSFANITADDFSLMMSKLQAGYLSGAKFALNRNALHYVRVLKDGESRPIFAMPGGTVPGTIYGVPYMEVEKMNGTSSAGKCIAMLGNWKKYAVGRRVGTMALDADPYGLFTKNQTRFRMVTRWGLKVGIANAFVRYMTAAQ